MYNRTKELGISDFEIHTAATKKLMEISIPGMVEVEMFNADDPFMRVIKSNLTSVKNHLLENTVTTMLQAIMLTVVKIEEDKSGELKSVIDMSLEEIEELMFADDDE